MDYSILGWIVVGLIAGVLAKIFMPGKDPGGLIMTILIGIAGGLTGGFLANLVGIGTGGTFKDLFIATAGAMLLLWLHRMIRNRSA